jgi:hypothetical protein
MGKITVFLFEHQLLIFWLEITKSRQFAVRISEFLSQLPTLLQVKMVKQGKQGRVGAREGFPCNAVKLVLLANGNRYEIYSKTFFLVVKPSIHKKYIPAPTLTFFDSHSHLWSVSYLANFFCFHIYSLRSWPVQGFGRFFAIWTLWRLKKHLAQLTTKTLGLFEQCEQCKSLK